MTGNNKKVDFMMMSRKEVVMAFIEKLENVSVNDVDIIPALLHYVETGDEDDFKEFCDYHFVLSKDEKAKELVEAIDLIREMEGDIKVMQEYKEQYIDQIKEYMKWRKDFFEQLQALEPSQANSLSFGAFMDFVNSDVKQLPNWYQKRMYVVIDGKLRRIESVNISSANKVIFELAEDGETVFIPPRPQMPKLPHKYFYKDPF